uniref:NADH-ubiquinone oxidoreductase chain 1 n=1 Tax=Rhynchocinetes durbanensis TaxID=516932 RepID=A0A0X9RTY3_9EUCA|nr:NADH dehydrogenase subunit 1 [Rhynchocinetes durbanensis]AMA20518.1 NADH dehydrogenase subunit 1 [Rhynchocinetes durbanensis]
MALLSFFMYLVLIIFILLSVAFLTLFERKVLGYMQLRQGPVKVGYKGLFQPFSDVVKLFLKEGAYPSICNYLPYYVSPILSVFFALLSWSVMPYELGLFSFSLGVLFFLCCMSLGVYTTLSAGWASNSKYSLLGCLRAVAQTISYEVSLALTLLGVLLLVGGLDLVSLISYQRYMWFIFLCFPLSLIWFASCLAETNRTPFDLAEGESELVSGFNTEYSGGGFALIFMAEYASIIFMSALFTVLFLGGSLLSYFFYVKVTFMTFCFIWVRGTLPRFRYDKLMMLSWKSFLPVTLNFGIFFMGLKFFCFCLV